MDTKKTISGEIRAAAKAARVLGHNKLAASARIDKGALTRFISGESRLGQDALDRLAAVLRLRIVQDAPAAQAAAKAPEGRVLPSRKAVARSRGRKATQRTGGG